MATPHSAQFIALQTAVLGRFSLERQIGRGGSATIYLARDVTLNRPVAIKLLDARAAANPKMRERFTREARTAGLLSQPNIVPIHAVEEHGDVLFFVMGYVDGETLGQRIRRTGMLEIGEATRLLREVAWALGYAHARGITHRDVKPDNVMIERDAGRAIVTDFGIARHVDDPHGGEIIGTADYMSPEQAGGHQVDARSDIYSLGVTAFQAITGRLPFQAPTELEMLRLHETQAAPSVRGLRSGLPGRLVEIVDRCLAKNPDDRFQTAEELATALGDAAGVVRGVPPAVDDFLQMARSTGRRLTVLAPLGGVLTYALGALGGFGFGTVMLVILVMWILTLELVLPPLVLLRSARRVLTAGINYEELYEILRMDASDIGPFSTSIRRFTFTSARTRLLLGTIGLVVATTTFITAGLSAVPENWRMGFVSFGVAVTILAAGTVGWGLSSWLGGPAGRPSAHGLWMSPFGRRFFRLAALGFERIAVAERPSLRWPEVLLGQAARTALADLDGLEQRDETLEVIAELETRIGMLREERDRVDDSTQHDTHVPGPPRDASSGHRDSRLAANRQIEIAIAALEAIRLDLVRIRSGVGSHDTLRSNLTGARHTIASGADPSDRESRVTPRQANVLRTQRSL